MKRDDEQRESRRAEAARSGPTDTPLPPQPAAQTNTNGRRRSRRIASAAVRAIHPGNPKPPTCELEFFQTISFINSLAGSNSRAGACGGGFSPGLLEFAYPAWAGAAECQQPTNAE